MLAASSKTVICWAMGIVQHRNGVATVKEISNLAFLQGNIGKPGAGLFPVRGHSNVQGDRTMGIWERPPGHFLDALRDEFGFEPPREHGLDGPEILLRVHAHGGLGGLEHPDRDALLEQSELLEPLRAAPLGILRRLQGERAPPRRPALHYLLSRRPRGHEDLPQDGT